MERVKLDHNPAGVEVMRKYREGSENEGQQNCLCGVEICAPGKSERRSFTMLTTPGTARVRQSKPLSHASPKILIGCNLCGKNGGYLFQGPPARNHVVSL